MDSPRHFYQRIVLLACASLMGALAGCTNNATTAFTAPHSAVPRATALHLAKQVAANIDGQVFAIAPSGSMIPTLDEGSIVTIEKVTFDRLKKGDIVVYRSRTGMIIIHRLYERHTDHWFVLGDHNTSVDRDTVSAENLLGRVCAIFYTSAGERSVSQGNTSSPVAMAVADTR